MNEGVRSLLKNAIEESRREQKRDTLNPNHLEDIQTSNLCRIEFVRSINSHLFEEGTTHFYFYSSHH